MVPIDSTPPTWIGSLPKSLRKYFEFRMDALTDYESMTGLKRAQLNWPMKFFSDQHTNYQPMTHHEMEEHYATPKPGVDFLYDSPPGSRENPLVIEQCVKALDGGTVCYCAGNCAPHVPSTVRYFMAYPMVMYECQQCGAHMTVDAKEDVFVLPTQAPEADEAMPPFEYLKGELDYWMKRGIPIANAVIRQA